jgi:hypothetical protein
MGRLPTAMALKRLSMGLETGENTALPLLSTVGSFSLLPEPLFAGDSVVPDACPLVLAAAQASPAAIGADEQSDRRLATIPDGPVAVEPVGTWPRSVLPALLCHVGR